MENPLIDRALRRVGAEYGLLEDDSTTAMSGPWLPVLAGSHEKWNSRVLKMHLSSIDDPHKQTNRRKEGPSWEWIASGVNAALTVLSDKRPGCNWVQKVKDCVHESQQTIFVHATAFVYGQCVIGTEFSQFTVYSNSSSSRRAKIGRSVASSHCFVKSDDLVPARPNESHVPGDGPNGLVPAYVLVSSRVIWNCAEENANVIGRC